MSNKDNTPVANPSDAPSTEETKADEFDALMKDFLPEPEAEDVEDVEDSDAEDDSEAEDELDEAAEDEEEETSEQEEEDEEPEEKPRARRRKSPQKRIQKLLAEKRQLEEELQRVRSEKPEPVKETAKTSVKDTGAPDPNAVDENGDLLYPLGEYDPAFLDAKFDYKWQQKEQEARQQKEQERVNKETEQLVTEWTARLEEAEVGLPDLRETIADLEETFADLSPDYGQYLAATIMSLDNGPEILYYLAQNPDEADAIVESGSRRATVALGKLDARFDAAKAPVVKKATSKAPSPPRTRARGTSGVDSGSSMYDKMLREFQ